MSQWLIVGISGVTNGGKSTLTKRLVEQLPCTTRVLSQDDYFYPEDSCHHIPCPGGLQHHNWDVISSVDMERMMKDIKQITAPGPREEFEALVSSDVSCKASVPCSAMGTRPVMLLDGFLLFGNTQLAAKCDLRYFFTLTREQCWQRRCNRVYEPPDPPGYFDVCVWPMYESHLKYVKESVANVVFLNGMEDPLESVLRDIVAASKSYPSACRPFINM